MNRLPVALLAVALGLPATAMAQSGPTFSLIGGGDISVSGDVHKGAIAPIPDLGPLNPDLAGVSAELRIGAYAGVEAIDQRGEIGRGEGLSHDRYI